MADGSSRRAGASSETSIVRVALITLLPLAELENVRPGSV